MIKHKPLPVRPIVAGVVLVVSVLWSWLFGIRVAALSSSVPIGYLCTVFAFVVIVGISSALFVLTVMYFVRDYRTKQPTPWFLVRLFVGWAAVELVVSIVVSLVWIGRDGSLDSILPFGSLAPALSFTPLRFLARLVGFYGLSAALVVLVSVLVFKKLRRYAPAVVGLIVLATIAGWGLYRQPAGPELDVQIVADHEGFADPVTADSTLVVLPEYGLNGIGKDEIDFRLKTPTDKEVFYVGSQRQEVPGGVQNVLIFGSTTQGVIEERAKTRLIAGGEYLPYAGEGLVRLVGADTVLEQFQSQRARMKGSQKITPLEMSEDIRLGSGVCASIIAPKDYRGLTKDGATVLTNSAALGVFNSPLFTHQHQGLARFMAVANARPFIQSSSDGLGFVIDHNGQMLRKITPVNTAQATIRSNNKKTLYTYAGEWPAYLGLVLALGTLVHWVLWRRRSTSMT